MARPKSTHCLRGHAFTDQSTVTYKGQRQCKACVKIRGKIYRDTHKPDMKEKIVSRKLRVLTHYGPGGRLGCCWPGCLIDDVDMLSLDYTNNDGVEHRRAIAKGNKNSRSYSGTPTYIDVEKRGYPSGFQTLCCNHQMKKEIQRRKAIVDSSI